MALNLSRDAKLYVSTVDTGFTKQNTFEVRVLDGFSFSQGTESTTITVDETGQAPVRGQKMFNTALNPVDLSFSTYIRPTLEGGLVTAPERILWEAFVSQGNGDPLNPFALTPSTESSATGLRIDFDDSDVHTFLPLNFYLDLGAVKYKISDSSMSEVSVDFDIAGIATLSWTGQASTMLEAQDCEFPTVFTPIPDCAIFLKNKLSTLTFRGDYGGDAACVLVDMTTASAKAGDDIIVSIDLADGIVGNLPDDVSNLSLSEYTAWWEDTFCGVKTVCVDDTSFWVCAGTPGAGSKLTVIDGDVGYSTFGVVDPTGNELLSSLQLIVQNLKGLVEGNVYKFEAYEEGVLIPGIPPTPTIPATPGTGTITLSGGPEVTGGTITTTIDGTPFAYTVSTGDTKEQVAEGIAALIDLDVAYIATSAGALVTITTVATGLAANVPFLVAGSADIIGDDGGHGTLLGGADTVPAVEGTLPIMGPPGSPVVVSVTIPIGVTIDSLGDAIAAGLVAAGWSSIVKVSSNEATKEIMYTNGVATSRLIFGAAPGTALSGQLLATGQVTWRTGRPANVDGTNNLVTTYGSGGATFYEIPLTGGSFSISNNITYLTPEELGVVNIPIGYFSGTRAVTATFEAYLRTGEEGQTGNLLNDLLGVLTEVSTSFEAWLTIGGASYPDNVEVYFPSLHLSVPTINTADVISTTIEGTGQATEGLIGTDEVIITYHTS